MKKNNFLPLLLVFPLLTGCSNNIKVPKFADKGEEVSIDKMALDYGIVMSKAAFAKTDAINSFRMTKESSKLYEENYKGINDFTGHDKNFTKSNFEIEYDSKNYIAQSFEKEKTRENTTYSEKDNNYVKKASISSHKSVQEYEKDTDHVYVVTADKENKILSSIAQVNEENSTSKIVDAYAKSVLFGELENFEILLQSAIISDSEKQKNYKLYENGNIFTIEYNQVIENEEYKNSSDQIAYLFSSTTSYTIQFDFTDGAWVQKYHYEQTTKKEYKLDDRYGYSAGDVLEKKTIMAGESKTKYKNVSLEKYVFTDYKERLGE